MDSVDNKVQGIRAEAGFERRKKSPLPNFAESVQREEGSVREVKKLTYSLNTLEGSADRIVWRDGHPMSEVRR